MEQARIVNESRRDFLKVGITAGAGLTLGIYFPLEALAAAATDKTEPAVTNFEPNAFVRIGRDGRVTIIAKHLEMGQGAYTGLATLLADELDADWDSLVVEAAPADVTRYANTFWGKMQGTGGSSGLANSWLQMRRAGAAARAMLVSAAAKTWGVPEASLSVSKGMVTHAASRRRTGFGELVELAATLPVPAEPKLKQAKDFTLIGKSAPRKDAHTKVAGTAQYTIDVMLPDMVVAVVAHAPRFGAKLLYYDAKAAKAVPGVVDVLALNDAVVVYGRDFWSAKRGRDALHLGWDEAKAFRKSSDDLFAEYRGLALTPGDVARNDGDVAAARPKAKTTLEANFEFPYLAHATMEPMNCVVRLNGERCDLWYGVQLQTADQVAAASMLGLKPEQVEIHMLYAGGSFGRRANPNADYVREAVAVARALRDVRGGTVTVKMLWTREDDMRAGYYRPMYVHRIEAGLDAGGMPLFWQQRVVGQSIVSGSPFAMMIKNGIDPTSVEGASTLPYAIPNLRVELHTTELPVPVQWWRSVGSTHTAFSTEVFLDELAHAAGRDALEFRRSLLAAHPRHRGALELAAAKAGWGQPLKPGKAGEMRGRGLAVHESFKSYVAQVAEVTVRRDKSFRVDRVVCAVDCGIAVNPDVVRAQMEGGIAYGLGAALHDAITLKDGQVEQSNFHDYVPLRIDEMPPVEVYIVPSAEAPTGVGEPGTPPIAPAVANALFAASGQRLRTLPLKLA
jgi:isoquinoline 1-oxidoreductase beta subunit